jgi:hypothetical protein
MQRSTRRVLLCAAACAGAAAGTALAGNSGSFSDKTGDARPAPDLASLSVSNDDNGTVTMRIGLADRNTLASDDEVQIGLDTDQNPDTGSMFYGAEYGFDLTGPQPTFLRAGPSGFLEETPPPGSFQVRTEDGAVTFVFKASELGLSPTSGLEIWVYSYAKGFVDTQPDIRTLNYQLTAGTPRPAVGQDSRSPVVEALKSRGTHGKTARLFYIVRDGHGESADTIRIFKRKKLLKTVRYALEDTNPFIYYSAPWKVPKATRGALRFCVNSTDRAGNKSNTSCASLTIR